MNPLEKAAPVLFEDASLVAYHKPSGLLVAPDRWDKTVENLMDMVHAWASPDWFNAHRLDRGTSGIVLCAKTREVLQAVCKQFEEGTVAKTYLALVRGAPPEAAGRVELPLSEDPAHPGQMVVAKSGKPAITDYTVEERWKRLSLLRLQPRTGRTHQLRVHCRALGCPIVADPCYGDARGLFLSDFKKKYKEGNGPERPLVGRLALHAWKLEVTHPVTGQPLLIEAPIPKDIGAALNQLRRHGA